MKAQYEWGISNAESLLCKAPLTFSVRYLACIIYATFISLSLGEYQETHLVLAARSVVSYFERI